MDTERFTVLDSRTSPKHRAGAVTSSAESAITGSRYPSGGGAVTSSLAKESNVVPIREMANEDCPLITPGEYLATYVQHTGVLVFGCPKVRVDLRLIVHPNVVLSRWYRVADHRGRVRASRHSDIVRELSAVLGRRERCDRIPINALQGMLVRVFVNTVTKDHRQGRLADINRYSTIEKLIGRGDL